jgi:hypothetical protein
MTFALRLCGTQFQRCAIGAVLLALSMLPQSSFAAAGGRAQVGDNCTDFRTYAIGYSLGDWVQDQPTVPTQRPDRTIIDQRTVFSVKMASGKPQVVTPVGWELVVGNGETYFLASGGPPQLFIEPNGTIPAEFYLGIFRELGGSAAYSASVIDSISKYGASSVPCYSRPLRAPVSAPSPSKG